MNYSFLPDIRIYSAAGSTGDTLPASAWRNNLLWQGTLMIPHCTQEFVSYAAAHSQIYLSRGSNWSLLKSYIPDFQTANGVFNTRGYSEFYSSYYSPYFPGMISVRPGFADMPLHIVTCRNSPDAYVYAIAGAGHENTFPARIQPDGTLTMDTSVRLALPRFAATSSYAYLHGCLIPGGVSADDRVSTTLDFHINAAWNDSTLSGLHIALFNRSPSTSEPTAAFLNRWPLNGRSRFSRDAFFKGVLAGQHIRSGSFSGVSDSVSVPDSAGNGGTYDETSFLSGLPVGFLRAGK